MVGLLADLVANSSRAPLIGITVATREIQWDGWTLQVDMIPDSYHLAVRRCGGIPVLLPPSVDSEDVIERIDGLIISGGSDIDPSSYGEAAGAVTTEYYPQQDASEMALIEAAIACDMPMLLICRGFQLICVMHGGRLHQHLPATSGYEQHGGSMGTTTRHDVLIEQGSELHRQLGTRVEVNSTHHQGVADAGSLFVSGRAAHDGLIEAVERSDLTYCLGVQWHPERLGQLILYQHLIEKSVERCRGHPESM